MFNVVLLFIDVFTQPPPPGSKLCLLKNSLCFSIRAISCQFNLRNGNIHTEMVYRRQIKSILPIT